MLFSADALLAQSLQVQLVLSNYNGYAISCFGTKDGSLDVIVSGGTAPYTFEWSNGATTQNVSGLAAGYYKVGVHDSDTSFVQVEITLEQPERVSGTADPYEYTEGYHISCHSCYNGMISASATGGVAPYTYAWKDGSLEQNRSNLGARDYTVTAKDANGCTAEPITLSLREPQRNDWTMTGNTDTDPAWQYLGTADSKDLVLRTNGQERMRITSSGEVQAETLAFPEGYRLVWADSTGVLKSLDVATMENIIQHKPGCPPGLMWPWRMCGNHVRPENFIGSTNAQALRFKTDNELRMLISADGKVGMGDAVVSGAGLGGVLTVRTGWNDWLTLRQKSWDPQLDGMWHIHNPEQQDRLSIYYEDASGASPEGDLTLWMNGKVSIGPVDTETDQSYSYGLYLHRGLLTEKVKVALKNTDQWSDHVFKPGYRLMPLPEVATFIKKQGHLPGVPSAEQMVEEGLDVVRTNAMLMEKVEELTLHLIRMDERMARLEQENARLHSDVGEGR